MATGLGSAHVHPRLLDLGIAFPSPALFLCILVGEAPSLAFNCGGQRENPVHCSCCLSSFGRLKTKCFLSSIVSSLAILSCYAIIGQTFSLFSLLFCLSSRYSAKMRLVILDNYDKASEWAAKYVRNRILAFNPSAEKPFVLGLPTGQWKTS